MKVITLWQPWATFIKCGWKTIETRTHSRFKSLEGETIGIHAGNSWDKDWDNLTDGYLSYEKRMITKELEKHFNSRSSYSVRSAIICIATVRHAVWLHGFESSHALINCNIEEFGFQRFGLKLTKIKPITPIYAKGKQGIWNYDGEIAFL